ncbi:MAG: DNA repair protein RecN, partial [Acidobacteria bacterium]|nr:DNA repair protein RecN [Acidobacteriota bacterium]
MLRELHVRNLAVLAGASVRFTEGLNALTGETGAGKSIVVDSLSLLAGERASQELIRTGAEALTVSGVFEPAGDGWRALLEEAGLEPEGDELLVRREIGRSGRNRVFVNDQPTTLRLLTDLAPFLLRIHGQRSELGLISPELQRRWLDKSGGPAAKPLLEAAAEAYAAWSRLAERLAGLAGDQRLRWERIDLLRFQLDELESARLVAGEDDELRRERDLLRHSEAIVKALGTSVDLIFDDEDAASTRLGRSADLLGDVARWTPDADAWAAEADELRIRAEELARVLRQRLDGLEADPRRLDEVEDRLAVLERLTRKYGATGAELIELKTGLRAELDELEGDSASLEEVQKRHDQALEAYRAAAEALSRGRRQWGRQLAEAMARELGDLGLGQARLEVALEPRKRADSPLRIGGEAVEFGAEGYDQVSFLFAPNPGEEAQPLARIASGGELSRLSLALQLAAGGEGETARPVLVFDEVDTGIGGAEAAALGRKLQRLAAGGQILAVTHLPQVASFADRHFKVGKEVREGRTFARVDALATAERTEEIARMLAG